VLFLDEELQLLRSEKCLTGEEIEAREEKPKKNLKGGGGWYRVRRPLCFFFLDVFSPPIKPQNFQSFCP
jgi:hypothetical protein